MAEEGYPVKVICGAFGVSSSTFYSWGRQQYEDEPPREPQIDEVMAKRIQGIGQPDVIAKFHVMELPVYGVMAWLFIWKMGITGAALAQTLRIGYAVLVLFVISFRLVRISPLTFAKSGLLRSTLGMLALIGATVLVMLLERRLLAQMIFVGVSSVLYGFVVWRCVLDDADRTLVISTATRKES